MAHGVLLKWSTILFLKCRTVLQDISHRSHALHFLCMEPHLPFKNCFMVKYEERNCLELIRKVHWLTWIHLFARNYLKLACDLKAPRRCAYSWEVPNLSQEACRGLLSSTLGVPRRRIQHLAPPAAFSLGRVWTQNLYLHSTVSQSLTLP